jgi:hypothetical protein
LNIDDGVDGGGTIISNLKWVIPEQTLRLVKEE